MLRNTEFHTTSHRHASAPLQDANGNANGRLHPWTNMSAALHVSVGEDGTYSESRIGSEFQETFDSWRAQVGCSNVQGGAKVKVTTGGVYIYKM